MSFKCNPTFLSLLLTAKLFLQVGHELPPPHDVIEKLHEAEAPAFHSKTRRRQHPSQRNTAAAQTRHTGKQILL